jgi:membrane-bound lytic murein transglycosylase A
MLQLSQVFSSCYVKLSFLTSARSVIFAAGVMCQCLLGNEPAAGQGAQSGPTADPKAKVARQLMTTPASTRPTITYLPVAFSALPNWAEDDHLAAFNAFLKSCKRIATLSAQKSATFETKGAIAQALVASCVSTLAAAPQIKTSASARVFFEQRFNAHKVQHAGAQGLLTGYYEPVLAGSRTALGPNATPIYRRPSDLVNLVEESQRGAVGSAFTHMRQTTKGLVPYATRSEIEQGALKGQGLELLFLPDPVEVFFLQIQGSGQVQLPDGTLIRVSYDGKNGHPYTSIGRYLIDKGIVDANRMTLAALGQWLKADTKRGRDVMWQNKSYVFFRELKGEEAASALGVMDIPLTSGRSLAVDGGFHTLGLPIFVSSTALTHAGVRSGFHRLMIAQDVGSAIKGPERGDLYFGSGDAAGKLAGVTKHPGTFYVLLPAIAASVPVAGLKPTVSDTAATRTTGSLPTAQSSKPPKAP